MKQPILFALIAILLLSACATNRQKLSPQGNLNLKSANVYFQQKDNEASLQKALELYEKVLADNPNHAIALKRSADLNLYFASQIEPKRVEKDGNISYTNLQHADKAIEYFQKTYSKYDAVIRIIDTYDKLNDDERAMRRDASRKKESSWVRIFRISQMLVENNMNAEAINSFEDLYALDNKRVEPLKMLVTVYQKADDDEKFEYYLDKVLEIAPEDTDMIKLMGAHYYNKENYEKALGYFQKTMASDPLDTNNMLLLANTFTFLKEYQNALDILVRVLRLEPQNVDALMSARDLAASLEKNSEEIEYWKQIIAVEPTLKNYEAYTIRLVGLQMFQEAMPAGERWYELDTDNKSAVGMLIFIASRIGRSDLEQKYSQIYRRMP